MPGFKQSASLRTLDGKKSPPPVVFNYKPVEFCWVSAETVL